MFAAIQTSVREAKEAITYSLCRNKSVNAINSFKNYLLKQDWKSVYVEDTDKAYNTFISIVTDLYDKNCPIVQKVVVKMTKKDHG